VRRQLLQDALRFYQEFLSERGDSPVIRSEAALAYRRMGMIQFQLGQPREAEESYRQAVGLAEKLFAEAPDDPAILDKLASIHNNLGGFYQATQRWPEAEENLKQAVALREQLDRLQPDYPRNRLNLAGTHANLVVLYRPMGRLEQAEAAFQKCKTLAEDLLRGDARNADCLHLLATCHQNVGLVYGAQDRIAEAEAAQQKALALYQQLLRDQPEVVDYQKKVAAVYNNLGLLYAREQNHAKAEAAYRQCLALHETIVRDHPKVVAFQVDLGASYGNMAVQARRSSPEESLKWSTRAIDTVGPVLEQDPGNGPARMTLFDAHMGRAITLLKLKRQADAAKDWKRTLELSAGQPHITLRLYRPSPLAHLGEHAQATAEMETLLAEGQVQPLNLYTFAYIYARCSAGVAKDARLPPVERQKLADKYGSRAVELLRKAQAASYFKNPDRLARMKTNDDLDAIRARSDFQKLLVELEAQMKK
jgi:tetratricopeptide (TPR) repeat protein